MHAMWKMRDAIVATVTIGAAVGMLLSEILPVFWEWLLQLF